MSNDVEFKITSIDLRDGGRFSYVRIAYRRINPVQQGIMIWMVRAREFSGVPDNGEAFMAALSEEDRAAVVAAMITATGERA